MYKYLSKELLDKLHNKLLYGNNTRSINLNANPGNLRNRIDIKTIDEFSKNFSINFLNNLLNESNFKIDIELNQPNENKDEDYNKKVLRFNNVGKRLKGIIYDNDEISLETGIETFGFGYPIVIKKSALTGKILQAPLFIWNLSIKKIKSQKFHYIIEKTEDNFVGLNSALLGFIGKDEGLKIEQLSDEILEDGIIDKNEIIDIINDFLEKYSISNKIEFKDISNLDFFLIRDEIDSLGIDFKPIIKPFGVFGIFKMPKHSLIEDIKKFINNFDKLAEDDLNEEKKEKLEKSYEHNYGGYIADTSQQTILNNLGKIKNQIIQGPPGTGKSKTLTGILTNALSNNKKVLVVCEKRTALDVLKNNLDNLGIGNTSALITDIRKDRSKIVYYVRGLINDENNYENNYENNFRYNYNNSILNIFNKKRRLMNIIFL